ncbi:MAG: hypothetical protein IPK82_17915 [Polyangiaceae bacterium]|nr:hypothetical protein [Polyangiaceae bacterium]
MKLGALQKRLFRIVLGGFMCAVLPRTTSAQPSQDNKVAAQALFDDAMTLRKKNDWNEACSKLQESQRLDPAPGTKFYLAECYEQIGKLASAWLLYTEVADVMANTGQQKRESAARERAQQLAGKVARLRVIVSERARSAGLSVLRDGVPLGEAQWGFAVPVDSGVHTIEATLPGHPPFRKEVTVTDVGSTVDVEIPVWGAETASVGSAGVTATATLAPTQTEPKSPPPPSGLGLRGAGFIAGGLGIVSAAFGAALGSMAVGKYNESNRGPCDAARDVCSPAGLALRADAITLATGSTVTFIVGGVLFAGGVVLVLLPSSNANKGASKGTPQIPISTAVRVSPNGISLEGKW